MYTCFIYKIFWLQIKINSVTQNNSKISRSLGASMFKWLSLITASNHSLLSQNDSVTSTLIRHFVVWIGYHQAARLMSDFKIKDSSYYHRLAQIAEAGCLDAVFFADNHSFPTAIATDLPAFWLNPLINLTAMSQVTNHIGLVSTISSTFSNPYTAARQLAKS